VLKGDRHILHATRQYGSQLSVRDMASSDRVSVTASPMFSGVLAVCILYAFNLVTAWNGTWAVQGMPD
jgi:hypothetical protein